MSRVPMRPIRNHPPTDGRPGERALHAGTRARERREEEQAEEAWIDVQEF